MRVVIITGSRKGTASWCLEQILSKTTVKVEAVILNEGHVKNKWKHYQKKLRKTFRIGILGALNGIRMRKWYNLADSGHIQINDLKSICGKAKIPFKNVPSLNNPFVKDYFRSLSPDLGLSLGNSYISPSVFAIPRYGMLNIHGEVLPRFQNAQSVIWQLYEGSRETGYTIHKIDRKIDTGDIILQERFPIIFRESLKETVSITSVEILKRAAEGLVQVLNNFPEYNARAYPQGKGHSYTTPGIRQFLRIYQNFKKLKDISPKDVK